MHTSRARLGLFALTSAAVAVLIACGGGGGGDGSPAPPAVNFGNTAPLPADITGTALTMTCADGSSWQCSGTSLLRSENGVAISSSGVQVYGRSTSDQQTPIANPTSATGFEPVTNGAGVAELRLRRNATTFAVERAGLLLKDLDIKWDSVHERQPTIEVFDPTAGVTKLVGGVLSWDTPLPIHTDTAYYDYATSGVNGTQANYANNRYFPRIDLARSCGTSPCPSIETTGIAYQRGDFRSSGTDPDRTTGHRLHSEGDVNAGDRTGFTNLGVPFAGNKGYRDLQAYTFNYGNLATWVSEETTQVDEWSNSNQEHTTNRRGVVAFGVTTSPSAVPTAGSVDYKGVVYGWYTSDGSSNVVYYRATATVSVNFVTRQVAVQISNAVDADAPATAVALSLVTTVGMGKAGDNVANYFTGIADTGGTNALTGGLGGRFFGPVGQGPFTSNQGPEEIAGSFTLKNATTKAATIGGFIGRRQ